MSTETSGRWGDLVLLWLWSQRGDGAQAAMAKTLAKAARALPADDVAARIEAAVATLQASRLLERQASRPASGERAGAKSGEGAGGKSASRAAAPKLVLTDAGNERALHLQGLEKLPKKCDFASAQARWLSLAGLGVSKDKLPKQQGFLAGLLRERLGLAVKAGASINAVRDALAWRELGLETDKPFTAAAVTGYLLSRRLGAERPLAADKALAVLAAKEVGAASATNEQIKQAALLRLVEGSDKDSAAARAAESAASPETTPTGEIPRQSRARPPVESPRAPETTPAGEAPGQSPTAPPVESPRLPDTAPAGEDDAAFAAKVLAAATVCEEGKFDEHHVFIARLWDHLATRGEAFGLDLDGFKERLVRANRARMLTLSRADFVEAMSPEDVRRSEVSYHSATFHFVRR